MFGNDRDNLRRYYCTTWEKAQAGQVLEPLEYMVAGVINQHPEYQPLLSNAENAMQRDYPPELGETNPFLHMGMHVALQEQLASQRPAGIVDIYQQLIQRFGDAHHAEHQMLECLAETLWEAQRCHQEPDAQLYLQRLRRLLLG